MTPAQVAHIMALAKECGAITYTHRSNPHEAAVSFGPIAWAKFVEAALLAPQAEPVRPANFDGVIPTAIHGYLRRCSSGGMSKKHVDIVQANVDEAERLGYFKLAIAETMIAARPSTPTGKDSLTVEPDERAEFEAWINRGERSPLTVKDDRGGYLDTPTHFRWTGWQARASKGTK